MSDIFQRLKQDHRTVEQLLERAKKSDGASARQLVEKIRSELVAHSEAEAEVFYRRLAQEDTLREQIAEARQEHHVVRVLLQELGRVDPEGLTFKAKLTVLAEQVRHHVEEEEREMFAAARGVLRSGEADELGKAFERAKHARA